MILDSEIYYFFPTFALRFVYFSQHDLTLDALVPLAPLKKKI
jgi:hypothetical protein